MAADKSVRVEVKGLRELAAAFVMLDSDLKVELVGSLKAIAQGIADEAASKVPSITGHAAGSIKARASVRGASIVFGGTAAPYFPWLDFGGSTGRGHKAGVGGSGSIRREYIHGGRYIYPTIKSNEAKIEQGIDQAVTSAAKHADFDVKGGL